MSDPTPPCRQVRLQDRDAPTCRQKQNRFRSRGLHAAAASLGVAAASDAGATIIVGAGGFGTGDTFRIDGTTRSEIALIENSMGMSDELLLEASMAMMGEPANTLEFCFVGFGTGMDANDYLMAFPEDGETTVDSSLAFVDEAYLEFNAITRPNWAPGDTSYAGFRFNDGVQTVYGWLEIEFTSVNDFNVLQFAYQDDGTEINVGATPEPGTALLLGLGLAGLGLGSRRVRRERLRRARLR